MTHDLIGNVIANGRPGCGRRATRRASALPPMLAALLLPLASGAQTAPETEDPETGTRSPHLQVHESIWFELAGEPEHHFLEARDDLLAERYLEAADALRLGSTFLKIEATRAQGSDRDALLDAYREIRKTADEVKVGQVKDAGELDPLFVRAHVALANHHLAQARELWQAGGGATADAAAGGESDTPAVSAGPAEGSKAGKDQAEDTGEDALTDRQLAGRHLGGAAQHVQRALTWRDGEGAREGREELQQIQRTGEKLTGDLESPLEPNEVSEAFRRLDDRIAEVHAGGASERAGA